MVIRYEYKIFIFENNLLGIDHQKTNKKLTHVLRGLLSSYSHLVLIKTTACTAIEFPEPIES